MWLWLRLRLRLVERELIGVLDLVAKALLPAWNPFQAPKQPVACGVVGADICPQCWTSAQDVVPVKNYAHESAHCVVSVLAFFANKDAHLQLATPFVDVWAKPQIAHDLVMPFDQFPHRHRQKIFADGPVEVLPRPALHDLVVFAAILDQSVHLL